MASSTVERDRAIRAIQHDFRDGLALAQEVREPWFRCQALAWVARFAPADRVVSIVTEAIAAAMACDEPYKVVAVSAWPIRAMIERDQAGEVDGLLVRLLAMAELIEHPVGRLDALFLLWQAMFPLGSVVRGPVQEALIEACRNAESWRTSRTLRDIALMIAQDDTAEARRIVVLMRDSNFRRQAEHKLDAGERRHARSFFWEQNGPDSRTI